MHAQNKRPSSCTLCSRANNMDIFWSKNVRPRQMQSANVPIPFLMSNHKVPLATVPTGDPPEVVLLVASELVAILQGTLQLAHPVTLLVRRTRTVVVVIVTSSKQDGPASSATPRAHTAGLTSDPMVISPTPSIKAIAPTLIRPTSLILSVKLSAQSARCDVLPETSQASHCTGFICLRCGWCGLAGHIAGVGMRHGRRLRQLLRLAGTACDDHCKTQEPRHVKQL